MATVSSNHRLLQQQVIELSAALASVMESTRSLRAEHEQCRSIVNNIPGISYRCLNDADYTTVFMGGAIPSLPDALAKGLMCQARRSLGRIIHPDDLPRVRGGIEQRVSEDGVYDLEYRLVLDGDALCWVNDRGCISRDHAGRIRHFDGMLLDISARKRREDQILRMAYHDGLTGLANRSLLLDRLALALARARRTSERVAIVLLDLDCFKAVNDQRGHAAGDRLLKAVAERLGSLIRETDTLARLGGDEFVLVLTDLPAAQDPARLAGKILDSFAQAFDACGETIRVTASLGVALYPDDAVTPDLLLHLADQAMYHAKRCGRNRYALYGQTETGRKRASGSIAG